MADDQKFVKVFGERNTGTRALIQMLAAQPNIRVQPKGEVGAINLPENSELRAKIDATHRGRWRKVYRNALRDREQALACPTKAWKHTLPIWDEAFEHKEAHVIFSVRNPYSWALSLFRRPYHQIGPATGRMLDFVTQPWLTVSRDNMPAILSTPMELWNGKVEAYGAFVRQANVPVRVLRFENFIADPEVEVRQVLTDFGMMAGSTRPITHSTKDPSKTLEEISAYYKREDWKASLTEKVVSTINASVDWSVAAQYGYYRLDPSDFPSRLTWKNSSHNHSLTMHSGSR